MCQWGTTVTIYVIRRNNPDIPDGWHPKGVDACIADYVQRMNEQGIVTTGCCCGHGKSPAWVTVDIGSLIQMLQLGYSNCELTLEKFLDENHRPFHELRLTHYIPKDRLPILR